MATRFRMSSPHEVNCREHILHFTVPKVVRSCTESDATKVEAQHFATKVKEGLGRGKDHFVVHRSAAERVRVADQRGAPARPGIPGNLGTPGSPAHCRARTHPTAAVQSWNGPASAGPPGEGGQARRISPTPRPDETVRKPQSLAGLGTVDDSDILRFTPSALGDNTAGSFALHFDGSDVGLTTNGEDIGAVEETADGNLLISTTGRPDIDSSLFEATSSNQ